MFKKYGSGTLLTVGVVLAVLGILLRTDIIVEPLGLIFIVLGIVLGILGFYNMLTAGDDKKSSKNE